ncbi:MAG: Arm DNA-binding domain-containing protein [Sphingomonadales bacterium]|jgi:hypothetical protein
MALTDSAIRALKPRAAAYKVADEKGLYLMVTPAGGKLWKLKFRNGAGIEKKLSLGAYPDLGLKDDFPFKLRKAEQDIEGEPAHARGRIERLSQAHERGAGLV